MVQRKRASNAEKPTHARNDKLEAAIAAAPDDAGAYLVYADWLQAQGDPRGELIVLQHANKRAPAKKLMKRSPAHFFGKLADAQDVLETHGWKTFGRATTWRWGYLEALWIGNKRKPDGDPRIDLDDALGSLLDHPSCAFLRELTVGINSFLDNSYAGTAKLIGARKLPTLRKLVLGDFVSDETLFEWSELGNLGPLYKAVPNLESLTLRSCSPKLGTPVLPNLVELKLLTGGTDKKSLAGITASKWPHLEILRLQLGNAGSPKGKLDDLAPIFAGTKFPKLRHLGLSHARFADDIAKALARSKIAARLETLDLSMGTLGDAGALALASGKWPKLKSINVEGSWLSESGIAALATIAEQVDGSQFLDGGDPKNRSISDGG